ncbi:MAG: hypothetical protein H7123_02970, partial [Thermoleophilia bacterium]|nr:hypothetical protein [Thermoleophilia bacterium]
MFDPSYSVAALPTYGQPTAYLRSTPVPQWHTAVQPGYSDGVAALAATQPTGYSSVPARHGGFGSDLLDALQQLIGPAPSNDVGSVAANGAGVTTVAAAPVAAPTTLAAAVQEAQAQTLALSQAQAQATAQAQAQAQAQATA